MGAGIVTRRLKLWDSPQEAFEAARPPRRRGYPGAAAGHSRSAPLPRIRRLAPSEQIDPTDTFTGRRPHPPQLRAFFRSLIAVLTYAFGCAVVLGVIQQNGVVVDSAKRLG